MWGVLKAAAAEYGSSKIQWRGVSARGVDMPGFADQHGIKVEASILLQPLLLAEPEQPQHNHNKFGEFNSL